MSTFVQGKRVAALLALTAPLATSLVLATAPAALASGSITSPAAEAIIRSGSSFTSAASVAANSAQTTMTLDGPAGFTRTQTVERDIAQTQTLSIAVQTGNGTTVRNGQWMISLSGGATGTRVFWTSFAPATPTGFSAQGSGARDVAFSWTRGSEPDLSGYALYDDAGAVIDDTIPTSACNGTSCSYALLYPSDNPGSHTYKLAARRPSGGCSGCGAQLVSGTSSASATLSSPPPPPPPSPTPQPTPSASSGPPSGSGPSPSPSASSAPASGGGPASGSPAPGSGPGASPAPGGSTTSPAPRSSASTPAGASSPGAQPIPKPSLPSISDQVLAARQKFALQFKAFSPSLGIPKLAPLPLLTLPTLPTVAGEGPLPLGTFQPSLPYAPQTATEPVQDTGPLAQPVAAVRQALDSGRLMRSLAGVLILLMAGAHVRRFLGSSTDT